MAPELEQSIAERLLSKAAKHAPAVGAPHKEFPVPLPTAENTSTLPGLDRRSLKALLVGVEISSLAPGVIVPMPTLPLPALTNKRPSPPATPVSTKLKP